MELVHAVGALAPMAVAALLPLADRRGPRPAPVLAAVGVILLCPLLVAGDGTAARIARFVIGLEALQWSGKLLDALVEGGPWPDLRTWAAWLMNPFGIVRRRMAQEPLPGPRAGARLLGGLLQALAGAGACVAAWNLPPLPFALEHAVRVLAGYLLLEGALIAAVMGSRLAGTPAREVLVRPWVAVTPADFWRRYNRVVGQALYEDCWKRWGGKRAPLRATLLVFLFSGLFHEYLFTVVLHAVQGWQLAFFCSHGLLVALTASLRPRGGAAGVGIALTLLWNLASSVLFFASMAQVFPGFWSHWPLPFPPR